MADRTERGPHGTPRLRLAACLGAGTLAIGLPLALMAQEDDGGGVRLTFSVDGRVEAHSNAALDPTDAESSAEAVTRLGFGASSTTRAARLSFDATAQVRAVLTGPSSLSDGIVNPDLRLSYSRASSNATFDAQVFWRDTDLGRETTLDDFEVASGKRQDTGASLALRWGNDTRLGFGLTADYTDTDYHDGSTEPDRRRLNLGAELRLDLSKATALTFTLTRGRLTSDNGTDSTTLGLDGTLSIARPDGSLTFGLALDDTDDGLRSGISLARSHERPRGGYGYRLGLTRDAGGDLRVTGGVNLRQDLPRGQITADLSRDITTADDDNSDRQVTRANLGLTQTLTDRTSLTLSAGFSESLNPADDSFTRKTNLGATLSHELGGDWMLDGGVSLTSQDTDATATAEDTSIFLGLRRTFEGRY
jgi:hypothetical protein